MASGNISAWPAGLVEASLKGKKEERCQTNDRQAQKCRIRIK
jgi:hypothetical protein